MKQFFKDLLALIGLLVVIFESVIILHCLF